jgi:hypothetical protein
MGKPERKRPLRKICRRGEYNINIVLQEEGEGTRSEFILLWIR